ncbi:hypothetical protein [Chroococcidiopsis sp. CCALA 051]|uniref:hypothetical protein n=1 Tax=Chroococcidiopsis sp. CCALA 051 TaxID=869949 RepID=UPI0011B22852|nr:hypothetical protein [Chroococcidiopsis sp. CCALA 051]
MRYFSAFHQYFEYRSAALSIRNPNNRSSISSYLNSLENVELFLKLVGAIVKFPRKSSSKMLVRQDRWEQ